MMYKFTYTTKITFINKKNCFIIMLIYQLLFKFWMTSDFFPHSVSRFIDTQKILKSCVSNKTINTIGKSNTI